MAGGAVRRGVHRVVVFPRAARCVGDCAAAGARRASPFWVATICTVGSVLGAGFGWMSARMAATPCCIACSKRRRCRRWNGCITATASTRFSSRRSRPIPYKVFTIASGVFRYNVLTMMAVSIVGRGRAFSPWRTWCIGSATPVVKQLTRAAGGHGSVFWWGRGIYIYYRTRYSKVRRIVRQAVQNESTGE
jgi:hypothetical protein